MRAPASADHPSEGYPADVRKPDQSPTRCNAAPSGAAEAAVHTGQAGRWRSSRWSSRWAERAAASSRYLLHTRVLRIRPDLEPSRCRHQPHPRQLRQMSHGLHLSAAQARERPTAATGQRGPQRRPRCCQHAQSALKLGDLGRLVSHACINAAELVPGTPHVACNGGLELRMARSALFRDQSGVAVGGGTPPVKNLPMTMWWCSETHMPSCALTFPDAFPADIIYPTSPETDKRCRRRHDGHRRSIKAETKIVVRTPKLRHTTASRH